MLAKEISSLQHPIVKTFVKLQRDRKFRYEKKQIVLQGIKLCSEAENLDILLVKQDFKHNLQAKEVFSVNDAILKKVTGLQNPEPVVALSPMPSFVDLKGKKWILALDGVSDPGNLGTLLRTALALGWDGAFLTESCVDPFNDKALRSAKGATLRLPLQMGSEEELTQLGPLLIADSGGKPLEKAHGSCIVVLGNEASGVSPTLKENHENISIPIQKIESLNVAAAGAILLYTLKS
ncbi:MAG: RNA methyltransferase [Simkaniaceae bacterium]|nr:RNA methyltransferase [Candidatus Sacchlamyda saccharinae]